MRSQRILIADDDPKLLTLVKLTLQKEGFATIEALDGEVALAQIKSEKPDLIIADITMPKIDGFELCTLVREDPELANTPFIFLTAKGELSDRVKGLNLGADDYISKPFRLTTKCRLCQIFRRYRIGPERQFRANGYGGNCANSGYESQNWRVEDYPSVARGENLF